MTAPKNMLSTLSLQGLDIAPSQVCGAIRLVPLLRRSARGDLRLAKRSYGEDATFVSRVGPAQHATYASYIPHGLVLSWNNEGGVDAAFGTQMTVSDGKTYRWGRAKLRLMERMAKRESGNRLRLLPLHLAMEGFLSLYFSGPDIAWSEYSRQAINRGLSPRWETSYGGNQIAGFEDALRTFEIHPDQSGVLVFVADALASAFVVPTPEDYRALHDTLLADFYGELLVQYALLYETVLPFHVTIEEKAVKGLADLRSSLAGVRRDWAEFQGFLAYDLLERPIGSDFAYQAGPFALQRFVTDLNPDQANHIGEAIVRDNGDLEYLKTYRLSAAQTRRAYLLRRLALAKWNLDEAAKELKTTRDELVYRIEKAGFGYMLAEPVRVAARKRFRAMYMDDDD